VVAVRMAFPLNLPRLTGGAFLSLPGGRGG